MQKSCAKCAANYEITAEDLAFYDKVSPVIGGKKYTVPPPALCPDCRRQRRLAFRNETRLYLRKCALTGKQILSSISPDKKFKVFDVREWWGDKWNALDYGRDFDFNRPFFEQFRELQLEVPRMSLVTANLENSPYVNHCWNSKNCHLCFDMGFMEDAVYCRAAYYSRDLMDCFFVRDVELSYELVNCQKCHGCAFLEDCSNCSDAYFSFDCKGCSRIAFCSNLRNRKNCIFNRQVSEEEFDSFLELMKKGSHRQFQKYQNDYHEKVVKQGVHLYTHNLNAENCTGDYILNSKNCLMSYECEKSSDIKFCTRIDEKVNDSYDLDHCSFSELSYEGMCVNGNRMLFNIFSYLDDNDCMYCDTVMSSGDCFGCVGLNKQKYCILNRKYAKDEYEELVAKIIGHMKKAGEWGQFFPLSLSPFCINETIAQEYGPVSEEESVKMGAQWKKDEEKGKYSGVETAIPDEIADVNDDITSKILSCGRCGHYYRIIEKELKFLKKQGLPVPRSCPDCRHIRRKSLRTERHLFDRACAKCDTAIQTSYAPDRPEIVYCEKCYLEAVY